MRVDEHWKRRFGQGWMGMLNPHRTDSQNPDPSDTKVGSGGTGSKESLFGVGGMGGRKVDIEERINGCEEGGGDENVVGEVSGERDILKFREVLEMIEVNYREG